MEGVNLNSFGNAPASRKASQGASRKKKAVLMMAGGFLLLIVAVSLLIFTSSGTPKDDIGTGLANLKKEILMSSMSSEPLSDAKKQEILKAISGNEIDKFNFTTEEVARIVKSLNR